MKEITGRLNGADLRIGVVVSRFNELVTDRLLKGALDVLHRLGVPDEGVTVVHVPGSFEIPFAARKLASAGICDAVVCLGTLIRGETDHYEYLASHVTGALSRLALDQGVPMTYGLITADTTEQAVNRAGLKHGNKGAEAASAAVEMADLARRKLADG